MAIDLGVGLIGTGLTLGLRHGIDWDHIAAITDVTSTQGNRLKAFGLGTLYALGHAFVVIVLGLLAILLGTTLPSSVDKYMESVVGVTLILLAVWVFWSLIHNRENFRMQSRWMLLFRTFRRTYHWLEKKIAGHVHVDHQHHQPESEGYGAGAAYGIGMIHGIGAETGTQVLLFATVAGATSDVSASLLLVAFVVGLVISNSLIALASITGLWGKRGNSIAYQAVGVVVGVFSLTLGIVFLAQKGDAFLPALLS